MLARGAWIPSALWLESDRVLVASQFEGLLAVPRGGGEATVLAGGAAYAEHVAATERFVWAIAGGDPRAFRLPRP